MKRALVQAALDQAFTETFVAAYRNKLLAAVSAGEPDPKAEADFDSAFKLNIESYIDAESVITAHPDLED